jgi:hypothetical protein
MMNFFDVEGKVCELGFPTITGGATLVPFDFISNIFRGTKGAMLDMIRVPDKLLAMIELTKEYGVYV